MIDMSKEYVTRGEKLPVRIYSVGNGGQSPVHGAVFRDGIWESIAWSEYGAVFWSGGEGPYDLIEKPQTITRWVNVDGSNWWLGAGRHSREDADASAPVDRIGVIRIEYTGDQFEVFKDDV